MVSRSKSEHDILDSVIIEIGLTWEGGSCMKVLGGSLEAWIHVANTAKAPTKDAIDFIFINY